MLAIQAYLSSICSILFFPFPSLFNHSVIYLKFSSFSFVFVSILFCLPVCDSFFPFSFFVLAFCLFFLVFSIPFSFSHFLTVSLLFFQILFASCSIASFISFIASSVFFVFILFKVFVHCFGTIPCIIHAQLIFRSFPYIIC